MDITSLLLSKKYVDDSLVGAGAVKGKSAYEVAQMNGFTGSEKDWLASLVGVTPHIGENGHWFIDTKDTGVIASPSLAGYATEDYVKNEISIIDLSPYASKKELTEAILGIKIPDVSNFVTQKEIDKAIDAIDFPEPDLTPYAKKTDIPDVTDLISQEELQEAIDNIEHPVVDLSEYAKKDELPSLVGLATEQFVQDKIGEIEFPSTDLTGYATEEYVRQKIAEAQMSGDVEVDLSDYYTKTEIDSKFDNIDIPEVDLNGLATESYVDEAINSIVIPSTDGLATEEFVEEAIASIEVPSIDGLATESYVDNAIANIEHPTVDLESYAKKTDLPSLEGFATEKFVENKIAGLEIGSGQISMEALTEAEILAIIGSTEGGIPVTPSGQILKEMSAEDVQNIIKG